MNYYMKALLAIMFFTPNFMVANVDLSKSLQSYCDGDLINVDENLLLMKNYFNDCGSKNSYSSFSLSVSSEQEDELDERNDFLNNSESVDAKSFIMQDLNNHGLLFLRKYFETSTYDRLAKNIEAFTKFVLKDSFLKDEDSKSIVDSACYDPNSFVDLDKCKFGYVHENDEIIGICSNLKKQIVLWQSEDESLSVDFSGFFFYLFQRIEKRTFAIKGIENNANIPSSNILTQDVLVDPGNRFVGTLCFIHKKKVAEGEVVSTIGYQFMLKDKENVTLIPERKYKIQGTGLAESLLLTNDNIDVASADNPFKIDDTFFYRFIRKI